VKAVACLLCGADDKRLIVSGRDRDFPQNPQLYTIYACNRCGLVYLTPRPDTSEELAEIYPFEYDSYMKESQRFLIALRRLAWRPELREIIRLTGADSPILEVGCATGEFLAGLRCGGRRNVQGLEFSPRAAEVAQRRHGLPVRSGDLLDAHFPDAAFDLVVMRHVLEHVPDPYTMLSEIRRILRPAGRCIFTIPNIDSHTARLFGPDWYGHQIPRHFYAFPHRPLTLLLRRAGLDPESVTYIAAPNVWIGSVRFWLMARGATTLSRFFRYENPLALALFAPLGLASALLKSSGSMRVIVQKRG
jgi:SAM-dependent methyltransferase